MGRDPVRSGLRALGMVTATAAPCAAWACPFCASETGQQIYDGIFDASFASTLLLVLSPFPVLAGTVWLVNQALRPVTREGP